MRSSRGAFFLPTPEHLSIADIMHKYHVTEYMTQHAQFEALKVDIKFCHVTRAVTLARIPKVEYRTLLRACAPLFDL